VPADRLGIDFSSKVPARTLKFDGGTGCSKPTNGRPIREDSYMAVDTLASFVFGEARVRKPLLSEPSCLQSLWLPRVAMRCTRQ